MFETVKLRSQVVISNNENEEGYEIDEIVVIKKDLIRERLPCK
jgi:hypothetical protein